MSKPLNLVGEKFGRLTVIERCGSNAIGRSLWACACDCGKKTSVAGYALKSGNTSSCGCFHKDQLRDRVKTHGGYKSPEFSSWINMRTRCNNPKSTWFIHYGGRGIKVCERWEISFENFIADMGKKPSAQHSIERVNNNGNYEPSNCVWATKKEQARNRRKPNVSTSASALDGQQASRSSNQSP